MRFVLENGLRVWGRCVICYFFSLKEEDNASVFFREGLLPLN